MTVSDMIGNLMSIKTENQTDDPEIRFFIINEQGEKVQVFVEDVSSSQKGVEILLE